MVVLPMQHKGQCMYESPLILTAAGIYQWMAFRVFSGFEGKAGLSCAVK